MTHTVHTYVKKNIEDLERNVGIDETPGINYLKYANDDPRNLTQRRRSDRTALLFGMFIIKHMECHGNQANFILLAT